MTLGSTNHSTITHSLLQSSRSRCIQLQLEHYNIFFPHPAHFNTRSVRLNWTNFKSAEFRVVIQSLAGLVECYSFSFAEFGTQCMWHMQVHWTKVACQCHCLLYIFCVYCGADAVCFEAVVGPLMQAPNPVYSKSISKLLKRKTTLELKIILQKMNCRSALADNNDRKQQYKRWRPAVADNHTGTFFGTSIRSKQKFKRRLRH